ncbi:hypothetical protein LLEC1_07536 [Akanthomyces lecanii]|uniref:Uncharacterized protein n=1 Tax=Cordyceps confragosa TaxID=2714763 RepID=A0A179IMR5_CORDF|nr:hypothetical protein LLEC1_07536 [Akanthomyces lecanii]
MEQMDLHLVWTEEPEFWDAYFVCAHGCICSTDASDLKTIQQVQYGRQGLRQRALGFLDWYTALLSHKSDFRIA